MSTMQTNEVSTGKPIEEVAFLRPILASTQQSTEGPSETSEKEGRTFFRRGYKKTQRLFVVLRGLPGCGADDYARDILKQALDNKVSTMVLLSTDDFFKDEDTGEYVFDKSKLREYHRANYKRAISHFINDTQLVILNNYNIKKSHYRHYVTTAISLGYTTAELLVGSASPSEKEFELYASRTEGRVPIAVIKSYSQSFEP